jgi:mannose-6-phosphate isomerase
MSDLYPLLMVPHFDRRPWGARDLAPLYDRHAEPGEEPIGEVWLTWDRCQVGNGPLTGVLLGELCQRFGRDLVGAAARETARFPLLMKFLFPREKLSVQVHPDDEAAQRYGEPCGKTECWYVVSSDKGAQIGLGLKPGTTRGEFEHSIQENRAEQLLNWISVDASDLIYVEAGTVHTLGGGLVILETQQNSDSTYRLYDYGRGRELHIERGLKAVKEATQSGKIAPTALADGSRLIGSSCFTVDRFSFDTAREFVSDGRSAQVLVAVNGCGVVEAPDCSALVFNQGEAVIVPAALQRFTIRAQWNIEFVRASLP